MNLTDHERERFAAWCEEQAETSAGLVRQMEAINTMPMISLNPRCCAGFAESFRAMRTSLGIASRNCKGQVRAGRTGCMRGERVLNRR